MKKIFYILASAIVALGAVACQNEVDENITPGTQNDVVSFTVSFDDNTRIALGGVENGEASFVFEGNETLYLDYNMNTFEFTNTTENPYTFTGEGEGLSEIVKKDNLTITNKTGADLQSASMAYKTFGEAAYFRFYGSINGDVTLSLNNYVIHCTTGADDVTLYCDKYDGGDDIAPESLVLPANGEYWINLENAYLSEINVSYEINGTTVKSATLDAKVNGAYGFKIFNLGTLSTDMTIANVAALIEKAEAGSTITLPAGATITGSEILTIDKNITIDGNGATLSSTAGRAINVSGEGVEVAISNLNIECTGERGVNVIQNAKSVTLTDVNITAANYAVNVASSAAGAVVVINGGEYNGLNVVNVGGTATVTIDNATINCNDNNSSESYSAIAINSNAENATITATNCTFNISGDSHIASNSGTNCSITLSPEGEVVENVAAINYGDYAYVFSTLAEAVEYANEKDNSATIVLLRDAEIAQVGTFKIDLNGCTLTAAEGYELTIEGTTVTVKALPTIVVDGTNFVSNTIKLYVWEVSSGTQINGEWPGNDVNKVDNKFTFTIPAQYIGKEIGYIVGLGSDDKKSTDQLITPAYNTTYTFTEPTEYHNGWYIVGSQSHFEDMPAEWTPNNGIKVMYNWATNENYVIVTTKVDNAEFKLTKGTWDEQYGGTLAALVAQSNDNIKMGAKGTYKLVIDYSGKKITATAQ